MSASPEELRLKKRMLRLRSERLRQTLGAQLVHGLGPTLGVADKVISAGVWLRRHPAWLLVPVAAILVLRRRSVSRGLIPTVSRWAGRGVWAWQTWLRMQPFIALARMRAGMED